MEAGAYRGFLVHAWADPARDRLFAAGRLEDGRSFAAVKTGFPPAFHVHAADLDRARPLLSRIPFSVQDGALESFGGREKLALLVFRRYAARKAALDILERAEIPSPDGDEKLPLLWLGAANIRGPVLIRGSPRQGRFVDLVFPDAELSAPETPFQAPLRVASIDIETDTASGEIRAIAVASASGLDFSAGNFAGGNSSVLVRFREPFPDSPPRDAPLPEGDGGGPLRIFSHPDEKSLLSAFVADIQTLDPDVLTGWNFLDFDFPRLAARCEKQNVSFAITRSGEPGKFFPPESGGNGGGETDGPWAGRRRSAAALAAGRQIIDALRIVRFGSWSGGLSSFGGFENFTLEAAAQAILGEGKSVSSRGEEKIAELDRLYREDPLAYSRYCARDAELVLRILAKTGLFALTVERATLTGVFLDKAWTSVAAFERVYGMELRQRRIAPPPPPRIDVSGAAGGTILESEAGLFPNVAVFDFRSLYPTIIRTFNIDPLSHARAGNPAAHSGNRVITAPNGAVFSREPGLLPELIARYFAARREALDAGDGTSASVYKILMNSFYGVLGTSSCRYGRTELAGAITSFAKKWLLLSRDYFREKGRPVLYGDTDSLFVETGLAASASYDDFQSFGAEWAEGINRFLAERIREEYDCPSFLELRFEKAYRRFLIPPLRSTAHNGAAETRGRAKGYGGYLLLPGGGAETEVKGMEAVRSDTTPLARRVQMELLELVFRDGGKELFTDKVTEILRELRGGKLDGELVYRKRLSRPPETYTSVTPPQVKAARALGWKGRRGTVEYVWTVNGPEPTALLASRPDYGHYAESQVLPIARSIAAALQWPELFPEKSGSGGAGQMELFRNPPNPA